MAAEDTLVLTVSGRTCSAIQTHGDGPSSGWLFMYAPGAGSNLHDPFGNFACRYFAARGFDCVRFQFPYMEEGSRRPDPTPVLEATWQAAIEAFRTTGLRTIVGGRSLGGRIASHVVARGTPVDALVLFAYPLLSASQPSRRRDAHLPNVAVPTLFCSGTRDPLGPLDDLRTVASKMPCAEVYVLEGADHRFQTLKSSGRTREDVWTQAVAALSRWLGDGGKAGWLTIQKGGY